MQKQKTTVPQFLLAHPSENQITFLNWICGFTDGEGCFSVSYRFLERLRLGVKCFLHFSLAQKEKPGNLRVLEKAPKTFPGGSIRKDGTGCYKYETRSLQHLKDSVIPFFDKYPLRTAKQKDFIVLREICSRMSLGKMLSPEGFLDILKLSESLNPSGKQRNSLQNFYKRIGEKKAVKACEK